MQSASEHPSRVFLSTEIASRREKQFAYLAVLASAVMFFALVPFAARPLAHVPAFIPAYEAALVIIDLVTAVLLLGQFKILRSSALLILASGYLFTAIIAFAHGLTFPEVFAPAGLLGAGPQSTAWLYMAWHGGFPLFVMVYALLKSKPAKTKAENARPRRSVSFAIGTAVTLVFLFVCLLTLFATQTREVLPALVDAGHFTVAMSRVVLGIWLLSVLALIALRYRRKFTVLDLWLTVVMCAWLFDIGLSAVFNAGRFDLGWYAGRIYGLLAASSLLVVLLAESTMHYARLAELSIQLGTANQALERLSFEDGLTGLANRRFFDTYLAGQTAAARRHRRSLAFVMCDVDAFKAYNDYFGHLAGDACLKQVSAAIRSCCRRPSDMAARYGGEEFALILPDTELTGAVKIAELVRCKVAQLQIPHPHSPAAPFVTISGGISILCVEECLTDEQLMALADRRLFHAKRLGRNRMVSFHEVIVEPAILAAS